MIGDRKQWVWMTISSRPRSTEAANRNLACATRRREVLADKHLIETDRVAAAETIRPCQRLEGVLIQQFTLRSFANLLCDRVHRTFGIKVHKGAIRRRSVVHFAIQAADAYV